MTIAQQIRKLQLKKNEQQLKREKAEAERSAKAFKAKLKDQRRGGDVMDPGFRRQLDAKAAQVRAGAATAPRADLPGVLEKLRLEGKLPTPDTEKVGYVPTPEEILGDDALPAQRSPVTPGRVDADCPPADEALSLGAAEAEPDPGVLSPEELAELDRLNPKGKSVARPGPAMHTASKHRPRKA